MLARVIENWLDSSTERGGYEVPFCQALFAGGHRILFKSSHGQLEQGKDIITVDRAGQHHAYQLKAGDLTLNAWRKIKDEVEELVRLPLLHPNVPPGTPFRAYLVMSGVLKDPTRATILQWATVWQGQGGAPLEIVDREGLLRNFLDTHGDILPSTPKDFERFLRLFLADRRDTLSKEDFAAFLESFLPLEEEIKRSELRRVFAGTAVLASYILDGYRRAGNYLAVVQGWILVISYLLALLEKVPTYEVYCRPSIELCIEAWKTAAESLTKEALASQKWWEGDAVADYAVRGWRTTVLLGHMSALALHCRIKGSPYTDEAAILKRLEVELRNSFFWGESAGPLCFAVLLLLWIHGQEELACQWAGHMTKAIAKLSNAHDGMGIPDPYIEADMVLRAQHLGEDAFGPRQTFRGRSFFLRVLVEFLARRRRKRMLKSLWYDVSEVDHVEFTLDSKKDLYRWRARTGSLDSRRWKHPQEWDELVRMAEAPVPREALLTSRYESLLLPFVLVYPHRMTASLARLIENLMG